MTFKSPFLLILVFLLIALLATAALSTNITNAAADDPDTLLVPHSYLPFLSNGQRAIAEAPVITSTPSLTATVSISYTYDVDATGIPTPTFSLVVTPSGMTIDSISGLVQWTPTLSGTYSVTVRASNGITPTAEQPFAIQVEDPPPPPELQWDPRLDQRFASLTEASVIPGEGYWRLIKAQWLGPGEAAAVHGPDHHILMDVLDEEGERLTGVRIVVTNGGASTVITEEKPGEAWAADFAMFAVAPAYAAQPNTGAPADRVEGMGLGSLEAPFNAHHTGYLLTWQWTIAQP